MQVQKQPYVTQDCPAEPKHRCGGGWPASSRTQLTSSRLAVQTVHVDCQDHSSLSLRCCEWLALIGRAVFSSTKFPLTNRYFLNRWVVVFFLNKTSQNPVSYLSSTLYTEHPCPGGGAMAMVSTYQVAVKQKLGSRTEVLISCY